MGALTTLLLVGLCGVIATQSMPLTSDQPQQSQRSVPTPKFIQVPEFDYSRLVNYVKIFLRDGRYFLANTLKIQKGRLPDTLIGTRIFKDTVQASSFNSDSNSDSNIDSNSESNSDV